MVLAMGVVKKSINWNVSYTMIHFNGLYMQVAWKMLIPETIQT